MKSFKSQVHQFAAGMAVFAAKSAPEPSIWTDETNWIFFIPNTDVSSILGSKKETRWKSLQPNHLVFDEPVLNVQSFWG